MSPEAILCTPIEVEVGDVMGSARPVVLRGWVIAPEAPPPGVPRLAYCLAGGGCTNGYFHLQVDGHDNYSMAEYLASRGAVVIGLDHLGVGASDPVEDLYLVTSTLLATAHDRARREVVRRMRAGDLVPGWPPLPVPYTVGVGHSMGGVVAVVAQARFSSFDALTLLGTGTGLPDALTSEEMSVPGADLAGVEDRIIALARIRFAQDAVARGKNPRRGRFFAADVPSVVRDAFKAQMAPLLPTSGLTSMIPRVSRHERAAVTVPIFFGFGDQDLTDDFMGAIAEYRAVTDAALYVLDRCGHCHNQSSGRLILWDRIWSWLDIVAP